MQEQPSYPGAPMPTPFWQRHKKRLLVGAAFVVLLVAAIVGGRLLNQSDSPNMTAQIGEPSMTMYYRDGKTVLWKSTAADWINRVPNGPTRVVHDELQRKYGSNTFKKGSWEVVTTFDVSLQTAAAEQLKANQEQRAKQGADQALLVAQDVTTGQIVSWAVDSEGPSTNVGTAKAETGTLILPFTYAAAMEQDSSFTPATTIADTQEQLPGYPCTNRSLPTQGGNCLYNFDYRYKGSIPVAEALATVRLVPAIQASLPLLEQGNSTKLQNYAQKLSDGGTFACYSDESLADSARSACYTAAAFGDGLYAKPLDMVAAYSTLANNGTMMPATSILSMRQGKAAVYDWSATSGKQAMKEAVSRSITGILSDAQASYTSQKEVFSVTGQKVGAMMGVENEAVTASTVHFTSKYAVGVWAISQNAISGPSEALVTTPAANWLQAAHQ